MKLLAMLAVLPLAGCGAFSLPTGQVATGPGGAYMSTKHVDGAQCPDLVLQGALNVSKMDLTCLAGSETAHFENIDPTAAMAQANQALSNALAVLAPIFQALIPVPIPHPLPPAPAPKPPTAPVPAVPAGDLGLGTTHIP